MYTEKIKFSIVAGLITYILFHPSTIKISQYILKYPVKHSLLINSLLVMVCVFGYLKLSDIFIEKFSNIGMKTDLIGTLDNKLDESILPEGKIEHKII